MKKRSPNTTVTMSGFSCAKIFEITSLFPSLHTYGVGLSIFRHLPENERMRAIEYSKYLLAYCLDYEVDSAAAFFRALRIGKNRRMKDYERNWVRCSYLQRLYEPWQQTIGMYAKEVPLGCFAVACMLCDKVICVIPDLKPDFLVSIRESDLKRLEDYCRKEYGFDETDISKKKFVIKDERVGDMENELQSADAFEIEDGE